MPAAVLEPHSPPGTPPPSTTSPTSETPSGITIYRVAPGEEQEEESDNEEEEELEDGELPAHTDDCLLYTSPSPRDDGVSRMPSSA